MGDMPFPAFSITEQDTQVITVSANAVRQWLDNSEVWRKFVFCFMARRMSHVMAVVEEVAFRRMDRRIAALLLQRGPSSGNVLRITHQDIAGELGASREVVSRILKDFEADECLILGQGSIHLTNIDTLQAKAELG
jgi:CRP/FNR family transcriptional regulator